MIYFLVGVLRKLICLMQFSDHPFPKAKRAKYFFGGISSKLLLIVGIK
jgi:hypothetical protein